MLKIKFKEFYGKFVDEKGDEYLMPISIKDAKDIIRKIETSKKKAA